MTSVNFSWPPPRCFQVPWELHTQGQHPPDGAGVGTCEPHCVDIKPGIGQSQHSFSQSREKLVPGWTAAWVGIPENAFESDGVCPCGSNGWLQVHRSWDRSNDNTSRKKGNYKESVYKELMFISIQKQSLIPNNIANNIDIIYIQIFIPQIKYVPFLLVTHSEEWKHLQLGLCAADN